MTCPVEKLIEVTDRIDDLIDEAQGQVMDTHLYAPVYEMLETMHHALCDVRIVAKHISVIEAKNA